MDQTDVIEYHLPLNELTPIVTQKKFPLQTDVYFFPFLYIYLIWKIQSSY